MIGSATPYQNAKLHFPSCEAYRQRVIRMGEPPDTLFNVGGLGDENIRSMPLLTREELGDAWVGLERPYALVTYHPKRRQGLRPK